MEQEPLDSAVHLRQPGVPFTCRELVFEPDGTISGMLSMEGEKVSFLKNVNPAATGEVLICHLVQPSSIMRSGWRQGLSNNSSAQHVKPLCCCCAAGAVEYWLLEVEGAMKRAMHNLTGEALTAYPKSPRTSWILQWPSQLVLNGSQASCRVLLCC